MRNKLKIFLISAVILSLTGATTILAYASQAASAPMTRKIIIFKNNTLNESAQEALLTKFGAVKIKELSLISGKAVLLPPRAEAALAQQDGILRIDDDVVVETQIKGGKPAAKPTPAPPAEVLPWGIDRIDAEKTWEQTTGDTVKVAIIDTGVDIKHPDLIDNLRGGVSTVSYTSSFNDDNGHGTHVAGIVAAADNEIGVIGAGPKIDLYAVKALNRKGSGYLSDIIEGLDWAITNGIQVVNMSMGTSANVLSFQEAIQRVNEAGIIQAASAGNTGGAVTYPAAYSEVIAVSATDSSNAIASWSSHGPEIDLAAPGVNIYSTYKGQTYKILSGTSMAAPHVTGAAALVIDKKTCDYDLSGSCSPHEVQQKLQETAVDLGDLEFDNLFGWGLVNAFNALAF